MPEPLTGQSVLVEIRRQIAAGADRGESEVVVRLANDQRVLLALKELEPVLVSIAADVRSFCASVPTVASVRLYLPFDTDRTAIKISLAESAPSLN